MKLVGAIVLVCCGFVLAGMFRHSGSTEDELERARNKVETIVRWADGQVEYAEADPEQPLVVVNLARSQVLNATLRHIGKVSSLRTLILTDCQRIDDEGVALLTNLTNLQTLDLSGTWITDSCFEKLAQLPNLRTLKVNNNEKLSGYGLWYFKDHPNLRKLDLRNTQAAAASVAELKQFLPHLEIILK